MGAWNAQRNIVLGSVNFEIFFRMKYFGTVIAREEIMMCFPVVGVDICGSLRKGMKRLHILRKGEITAVGGMNYEKT